MNQISFGTYHETSLIFTGVGEGKDTLVAPYTSVDGCLVAVKEGVDGSGLVVSDTVHETKTVKRGLQIIGFP